MPIDEEFLGQTGDRRTKMFRKRPRRDLIIALITLKYTQSNSVCYVKGGQAIGIGAGQQSRIHCTRLAGQKADNWLLRQCPKVLNLPFKEDVGRPNRDNAIDVYMSDDYMDVLADGQWQQFFTEQPEPLTREEKRAWLDIDGRRRSGIGCFLPVQRQCPESIPQRGEVHRAAGRLHQRRSGDQGMQRVRHRHVLLRHETVPSLRSRRCKDESTGRGRRRQRACDLLEAGSERQK